MTLKMKYFVLSPGSSDPAHAKASLKAVKSFANELREQGSFNEPYAEQIEQWADDLYKKRHQ